MVFNLALGQLPANLGFVIGQAAVGSFAVLLWQGTSLPWFMLGYFLLGGYKTTRSLATAQIRELAHQARMGLSYGLIETVSSIAMILSPILAGYLYDRNPVWMYPAGVILVAGSILVSLLFSPISRKRETQPEHAGISREGALIPTTYDDHDVE